MSVNDPGLMSIVARHIEQAVRHGVDLDDVTELTTFLCLLAEDARDYGKESA